MQPTGIPKRTISRTIRNPRLEIGRGIFPEECVKEAQIRFAGDDSLQSRSAYVLVTPPAELRWDFKEEARLYEDGDIILTGLCTEAKPSEEGALRLTLFGPFWKLKRIFINSLETEVVPKN